MRRTYLLVLAVAAATAVSALPASASPSNDDFASAVAVGALPFTDSGTIVDATQEAGEQVCAAMGSETAWYSLTLADPGRIQVDTFGSDYDTVLGLWQGSSLGALTNVACNDDSQGLQSRVFGTFAAGTYFIQIGGYADDTGDYTLNLATALPTTLSRDFIAAPASINCAASPAVGSVCFFQEDLGLGDPVTISIASAQGVPLPAQITIESATATASYAVCGSVSFTLPVETVFQITVDVSQRWARNCTPLHVALRGTVTATMG